MTDNSILLKICLNGIESRFSAVGKDKLNTSIFLQPD